LNPAFEVQIILVTFEIRGGLALIQVREDSVVPAYHVLQLSCELIALLLTLVELLEVRFILAFLLFSIDLFLGQLVSKCLVVSLQNLKDSRELLRLLASATELLLYTAHPLDALSQLCSQAWYFLTFDCKALLHGSFRVI